MGKINRKDSKKVDLKSTKIFVPNKNQIEFIRAMADPASSPKVTDICKQIGISRAAYYKWYDNPEFVNWFNNQWHLAMKRNEGYLDNIGLKKAASDFRYWEALQMKYMNYGRKEISQNLNVNIDLTDEDRQLIDAVANELYSKKAVSK